MSQLRNVLRTAYVSFLLLAVPIVSAQSGSGGSNEVCLPGKLCNPLKFSTFPEALAALLSAVVTILLPVAVLFLVYAGFLFVTAAGDTKKLEDAKKVFLWTVTGILLVLGAKLLGDILSNTINSIIR